MREAPPSHELTDARNGARPERLIWLYGASHYSKSLLWSFSDLLFAYFAHEQLGLSASDTGWILFISLLYGSGFGIALAALLSAFPGQERRAAHIQWIGAIATGIGVVLMFLPVRLPSSWAFGWLLSTALFVRTVYPLHDVFQDAFLTLLPKDDVEARRYVTVRECFYYAARVTAGLASFLVIGSRYLFIAAAVVAVMALAVVAVAWVMRRRAMAQPIASPSSSRLITPPFHLILPALVAMAAQTGLVGFVARLLPFVRDATTGATAGAPLVLLSVAGGVAGAPLASGILKLRLGFAAANVGLTTVWVVAGLLILTATTQSQMAMSAAVFGVAMGGMAVLVFRQLSAAVRSYARRTGLRTDLATFALLAATIKLGTAVAGWLLGRWLDGFEQRNPDTLFSIAIATVVGGITSIAMLAIGQRWLSRADR